MEKQGDRKKRMTNFFGNYRFFPLKSVSQSQNIYHSNIFDQANPRRENRTNKSFFCSAGKTEN